MKIVRNAIFMAPSSENGCISASDDNAGRSASQRLSTGCASEQLYGGKPAAVHSKA
ncbi:hypothetical protein [Allokutzneria multivorans]|uniref:hypothetical protein n=1 Tax=Allokutzneria multivorans TaxID=1142134 RepID=UPI0031EEEC6F